MCVFVLLCSCVIKCTGGFLCAYHSSVLASALYRYSGICVCMSVQTYLDARQALFPVYRSLFSHLYIYFSQRVLCSELPKDLFTQWLTDSCLTLHCSPQIMVK